MKWTEDQERAIYTDGTDILVAAAAGSGKTAVLVERIIQKLLNQNHPVNIDELLVVTFTNAAAQEMRNRVGEALESALKEHPDSNHLKKQLSLLQRAQISTLHSFCLNIVRKYSYQLDIDPSFRLADDLEADLIRQEILEELFEDWYGKKGEEQELFFALVDRFSSDRSDVEIESLVMKLYDFAKQNPWPEQWLEKMTETYHVTDETKAEDLIWMDLIKSELDQQLNAMLKETQLALHLTRESDGPYHYADAIDEDREKISEAKARVHGTWEELQQFFQENGKFKALSRKKVDCDEDKKEKVKAYRNRYKKRFEDLKQKWFSRSLQSYMKDLQDLYPILKQLAVLVMDFHQRFQARKKEQALVDFADLEHFALHILLDESAEENIKPSEVAKQYQRQFREILIDEYQDTNLVQETILQMITSGEDAGQLFMVGDVKQSIYRFRHAEPSLFISKYKRFAETDNQNVRIDLSRNFRSRWEVLSATNFIFRQILDEEVGEIHYDQEAELIYSNKIYDELVSNDTDSELLLVDNADWDEETKPEPEGEEDFRHLKKAQIEARAYAEKIKKWIGTDGSAPMQVVDKQTEQLRNIQYRDIVILLRSMSWAPAIVEELKQQGIPVYAELSSGYFEAIEVKIMLSLLKVIDNPQQDIPLASVLRSPIVGLDEEGLAQIRLAASKENYYKALKAYVKTGDGDTAEAARQFLEQLENWRHLSRQGALSELIWQIYRETGYYDFVGGIPGGKQRQANLRALYDRARSYETTSFRGLFRFLRFIERMEERGEDLGAARALGEQEDVVRIMTIHKSKGLEFPAVIVGAMDKMFNERDLKAKYLLHKDLGMGMKYIDPEKRIMYTTLPFNALKIAMRREMIAEEMRVLYVALTRAKEKLVMVGNVKDLTKRKEKWQMIAEEQEWVLPPYFRLESTNYLDWVAPALIRHKSGHVLREEGEAPAIPQDIWEDESSWAISVHHASEFANPETITKERKEDLRKSVFDWEPIHNKRDVLYEDVERRLTYQYPYEKAAFHRAKQSVTELKRQREMKDEYSGDTLVRSFQRQRPIMKRPRFMQENQVLTAAEKGSAMHTVMQHLPFERVLSEEDIETYIQSFVSRELLTREEADVIDKQAIAQFYQTEIGEKLLSAKEIVREIPFSLGIPAEEVYADWETGKEKGEVVLLQGVIDCLVQDNDSWILLDYKTDQMPQELTEKDKENYKKRYQFQLQMYRRAVEQIWNQPVKKAYLYFFDQAFLLEVE
ncbi:DNA helicase/exodeoxyribonuclease V, subunit A [Salinibacillus kushneri]|uniref:ATP-dependent helicase/nuclease subunit A n=1 Tax=Salinibacillus kushneri TaxID=237682 RepID=A0A1I0J295_9BACI|nr:helicase-exonuclease AddAB subunit AddA [Salinibacillus kushneri]SEU03888.1 DNA helicase/exodeoxyribonuclease V, subunit A [Salinibacillus kushneri]